MSATSDISNAKKQNPNHDRAGGLVAIIGLTGMFTASSILTGGLAGFALGAGGYYYHSKGSTFRERLPRKSIDIAFALALTSLTTVLGGIIGGGEAAEEAIKAYPQADMNQTVRFGDVACMNALRGTHVINFGGVDYQYTCK